ncbi:MAG: 2-succinyl-5-enolpyruvyl-6-hydroxy-3-cyclohexene-1-carboxylate synthase, partial [Veillonella sp.]|nr:2-succinyl-5-enolpyruvyl-6-hydroxy-3-cyclohexene-1-carboxylate synthase [Veillonella sp.]
MNEYLASFVDELHRLGLESVVYSAGSRSTSLAMLFEAHQGFQSYMNVDERSAAFFALGIAKESKKPVALVCTSGSAMGHYVPAMMEAKYAGVPLLVITADRPAELY